MSTSAAKRYTVVEYLALERESEIKHEYFDGEIFAMAGGTDAHSLTAVNLTGELRSALKGRDCRVYSADMRILCPTGLRTYPDASVGCDEPQFEGGRRVTLLNPQAIIEVLSTTTEAYDRGRKFDNYRTIESLHEYVLVSQDRPQVDHFTRRESGQWLLTTVDNLDAAVEFPVLEVSIAMAEIYADVDFEAESS